MTIPRRVLDEILAHGREAQPGECCGVLIGTDGQVLESARTANLSTHSTRYEIDPRDHFAARRSARARGLSVVGFYHSHPHSAPVPSETDRAEAVYDDAIYLIAGVTDGVWSARAFKMVRGEVEEVMLRVSDGAV